MPKKHPSIYPVAGSMVSAYVSRALSIKPSTVYIGMKKKARNTGGWVVCVNKTGR